MKRIVLLFLLFATVCSGNVWAQGVYKLVTDESELRNGGKVLIVCRELDKCVGQYNKSGYNNRKMCTRQVCFSPDKTKAIVLSTADNNNENVKPFIFTLEYSANNKYSFYDSVNNGYLNVTSQKENYLKVAETRDTYSYFSITIKQGDALIKPTASAKSDYGLYVNSTGANFSSYATPYKPVSL